MLTPTMIVLLVMTAYPLIFTFVYSFTDYNYLKGTEQASFILFDNYTKLFKNGYFQQAVWNTIKFTILAVVLEMGIGLLIAVFINTLKRGQKIMRTLLLLPYLLPAVTVALSWRMMLSANYGIVNQFLKSVGLPVFNWFMDTKTAFGTILVIDVWQNVPFVFLLLYASLQSVSENQYEAARIDGAGFLQQFWYVTLPNIKGSAATEAAVYEKNGVAKVVYLTDVTTTASADDVIFVVGDPATKQIKSSAGDFYEFKAVVKGESTTIAVKAGSPAAKYLVNGTEGATSILAKGSVGVFFGLTENSKGLVTDLKKDLPDKVEINGEDDGTWVAYEGTKAVSSSSGLVGFQYSDTTKKYTKWLGADDDAIVAYYEPVGGTLSDVGSINTLKTDTDDQAIVVTDDGSIIAVFVTIQK